MSKSKLKLLSWSLFKKFPLEQIILGLTTGLLIAAILAIDYAIPGINLVLFPLICLPLIFSMTMSHIMLHTADVPITVRNSWTNWKLYFHPLFSSSFRFWLSLCKALLVFFVLYFTSTSIASYILPYTNPIAIANLQELMEIMQTSSDITIDTITSYLYLNNNELFLIFIYMTFPCILLALVVFTYFISRESLCIHFRSKMPKVAINRFIQMTFTITIRRNRMAIFKDYMSLNWPLFILLVVGFAGGSIGGYFIEASFFTMFTSGLVGAIVLMSFFLPFYICNMRAIYLTHENEFAESSHIATEQLIKQMQDRIDLTSVEQEKLKDALEDDGNPLEDHNDDQGNKKDPTGS